MAIKELKTRIALKYDSYANWTTAPGKDLILLAGEIGICEIPSTNPDSNVAPTVLFKVGDGTKTFEALPWASAKAADVYSWAKASDVQLNGKTLTFIGTDKSITLDYITEAEVRSKITDALSARISAVEAKFTGDSSVETQITALDGRLDVIEGEGAGSVKKALADAKAYTDGREVEIKAYADQAEADAVATAKDYTDGKVTAQAEKDAAQDASISANTAAIAKEVTDRTNAISGIDAAYKAADKAISDKIGTVADGATVVGMISAAQTAAETAAQNKVDALANGQVNTNKGDIAQNKADIAQLRADLDTEATSRADADSALEVRLDKVETFFELKDGETLDTALDTLVEIQEYLNGEGAATGGLLGRVAANETAIDALEKTLADGGNFDKRIDAIEAGAATVEGRVDSLESITSGYTTAGSIKTAVEAAHKAGTDAAAAAGVADGKAVAAQNTANAVKSAVENTSTGLEKTKEIADQAAADVAALTTRVGTAEGNITTIQGIVSSGADANSKLRTDITELQGIVNTGANANATLRSDLTTLQGIVNNETTGLAVTKAIADAANTQATTNKADIAAIKADYLKAADEYIFNCGSATLVAHTND